MNQAHFLTSATQPAQYPSTLLPELALYGRSNCGKSSLVNVLTGRKDLARTSARPGVTHTVNFFQVGNDHTLADLPGYGYAELPESVRRQFAAMVETYFTSRHQLGLVLLLQDLRRTPGDKDRAIWDFLVNHEVPVAIIATKTDKVRPNQRRTSAAALARAFGLGPQDILLTSSHDHQGIPELLTLVRDHFRSFPGRPGLAHPGA